MKNTSLCLYITVLAGFFLFSGCCSSVSQKNQIVSQDMLSHHNFILQSVNGVPFKNERVTPSLAFNEGMHISGAMCNRFFGPYTLENNILKAQMASTMMMCLEEELNQYENLLYKMIAEGVEVEYSWDILTLRQGSHVFVYKLKDFVR